MARRSLALLSEGMLSGSLKKTITIASIGWLVIAGVVPPVPPPSTGSGVGINKYPKPNTYHPITFVPDYRQAKREDDELIEILKAITKIL